MLSNIKVRQANDSDAEAWNRYVRDHQGSGPFHLWQWRKAITRAYNHTPYYFLAMDTANNKIVGVLPSFLIKPPFRKGTLVSLPFCDYGGPLAHNEGVKALLCDKAVEKALVLGASLELRCSEPLRQACSMVRFGDKVRLTLSLPRGSDILFKGFRSKLRSQIRRPMKEGLYCRTGGAELIEDFYRVFSVNMRDLGSPVHSVELFRALCSTHKDGALVGVVYKEDLPVAGGIILLHRDVATIPWASSLRQYNRLSPNMLLYWSFLEFAADNNYSTFDFGRSSPGSGTYRFKKQWGAEPIEVFWYAQNGSASGVSQGKGARETAANLWSHLPTSIANVIGPKIRKYISL